MKMTLFGRMRQHARARRDRHHLQTMPDALLRDIGITRSEIDAVILFGAPVRPRGRRLGGE